MTQKNKYGFRYFLKDTDDETTLRSEFMGTLNDKCSSWTFQLEKGEITGKLHYQGRCSFKKAKRPTESVKALKLENIKTYLEHDEEAQTLYCTKEDTRILGPWSDKDKLNYIPRQIREINNLYPWQEKIIEKLSKWDTRTIHVIIDEEGKKGKTTLSTYCGVHDIALILPFCNDYKDLLRMCYDVGPKKAYIIDMPRAINKERLNQLYSAIETIKSGYAYDDRYSFKYRFFDCPNILVFTNQYPDTDLLSRDRWRLWTIVDQQLKKFNLDFLAPA